MPIKSTDRQFVILPVPFEATTSYGRGTQNGPDAILEAMPHVEEFDLETEQSISLETIGRLPALPVKNIKGLPTDKIKAEVCKLLQKKKTPIILGGEHSISAPAVAIVSKSYPGLSVLHFDAHADLRDQYLGKRDSHACAARRILDVCPNLVQVGVRNMSEEESGFAKKSGQLKKIHFAEDFVSALPVARAKINQILSQLSDKVYISVDLDVLDPSEMPSTGTPEPGGLRYLQIVEIIRAVAARKKIVGFDLVELSPIKGLIAPNFLAARLVYKIIHLIAAA